uniref:NACHT, LRR and PYD domains-containing protein 3 n=1 Tax=Pelodiscus sinensis TaxID=13735 RepID=K7FF63_PELSI
MLAILEELEEEQRKKFKFKLNTTELREGYKNIPKGLLQKADVTDMVDLLMKYYQEEYAVEVVINVLDQINNKDLAERLRRNVNWKLILGGHPNLKKHHQVEDKEHELLSRGKRHMEIMRKPSSFEDSHVKVEHLFDTLSDGTITRKVILQGVAGIGKTATVGKIMYDWSCGTLYQGRFDYVFHWSCRELNRRTEKLSLVQLILQNWGHPKPAIGEILSCPSKVLFIIDGFDELRFPEDYDESKILSCDLDTPHSAAAVVESLLSSRSLSEACFLVTTRPLAVAKLETHMKADLWAEILGFLEEDRKEFFKKFFKDEKKAAIAYHYIQENDVVFTMCFVPLICWIVCTTLNLQMKHGEEFVQKVSTTTQIFTYFVATLLQSHGRSQTSTQNLFHNLGSLAYAGMRDQKVLFDESMLRKCNLEVCKGPSTFLTELLQGDIFVETIYSFVHLSVQELFAALFTYWNKKEAFELLKEAFVEKKSHLILTVRFLCGLNNDESLKPLKRYYETETGISKNELLKWIKKALLICQGQEKQSNLLLELLHCLFEIQDEEFVIRALEEVKGLGFFVCLFLFLFCFVLKFTNGMKRIKYTLDMRQRMKSLRTSNGRQLWFFESSNRDAVHRIRFLNVQSHLRALCLDENSIDDELMKTLCNSLNSTEYRLQSLSLRSNNLTQESIANICSLFHCNMAVSLNLQSNSVGDEGVKILATCLKSKGCCLEKLSLPGAGLTEDCVPAITSLFSQKNTLRWLDLSFNNLGDGGVKALCSALKDKESRLEKLILENNGITNSCEKELIQLIETTPSLQYLCLDNNEFSSTSRAHIYDIWEEYHEEEEGGGGRD